MQKKYIILSGISISLILMLVATMVYPGGSLFDKKAIGFDWSKNFISNLFAAKAVNGADNTSRIWADASMFFLSFSFALFFIEFSKKIPVKSASNIIRYCGISSMFCAFLIVTPLHDIMVGMASTLFLLSIFYATVFVFKSKLRVFKLLCLVCLLIFYCTLYMYESGSYLKLLPVFQKITFLSVVILIAGLAYFTNKEDFESITK